MKIIHTADWHLCDTQMGLSTRGTDFTNAAMAVVETAVKHDVKVIVNAGDLLDISRPSSNKIEELQSIDEALSYNGITMLTISGNHDKSYPSWVDVAKLDNIINIDNKVVDIKGISFAGVPYMPTPQLKATINALSGGDCLVTHCAVKEFIGFESSSAILLEELPTSKFQAILLGDIHIHEYMEVNGCYVGYPGSIELCSRKEDKQKYVSIFEWDKEHNLSRESVPIGSRKIVELRIFTDDDMEAALAELTRVADEDPIVYIHYAYGIKEIVPRAKRVLSSDSIVKPLPIPGTHRDFIDYKETIEIPELAGPRDFIYNYFKEENELHELASKCCSPGAVPGVEIANYVANKLNQSTIIADE